MPVAPPSFCALGDCGRSFVPRREGQVYCCVAHRNIGTARLTAARRGDKLRGSQTAYPRGGDGGRKAHRIAAEKLLGRPLRDGEVVHHLDGDDTNFSPYNCIVFPSQSGHARAEALGRAKARKRGQRL